MSKTTEKEIYNAFMAYLDDYFTKRDFERTIQHFGAHIGGFGSSKDENTFTFERCKEAFKRDIEQAPHPIDFTIQNLSIKVPLNNVGLLSCEFNLGTTIAEQSIRFNHVRYTLVFIKEGKQWFIQHKHLSLPSCENEADEPYPIKELEARNVALKRMVDEKTQALNESLEKISVLANSDFLTGIDNRMKIDHTMEASIKRFENDGSPFSVILFDIDGFKDINDTHGHLTGDKILIETTKFVKSLGIDCNSFGRWGGDEFVLVCDSKPLREATATAEMLRKAFEAKSFPRAANLTISLGVSEVKENDTIETIITRCDMAVYAAKNNGKNQVQTR